MITVKNLKKSFGDISALSGVSFHVNPGETTGILGSAGAGKTTLCDILSGYLSCQTGTVQINGLDMEKNGGRARVCVGYLPDACPLYPDMTVEEYLTFICGINKVKKRLVRDRLSYTLFQTDLTPYAKKQIGTLDALNYRRVGIAGIIVFGPKVLILDQPFSGLHTEIAAEVRYLLEKLSKTYTILLSSDTLTNVVEISKKAIILNQGRIAADSSVDNFLSLSGKRNRIRLRVAAQPFEVRAAFSLIPYISEISLEGTPEQGLFDVFIDTNKDTDIRKEIWAAAVAANIPILEMRNIRVSIEDIFLQLTAKTEREG